MPISPLLIYEFNGKKYSLKELSDITGISYNALYHRIVNMKMNLPRAMKYRIEVDEIANQKSEQERNRIKRIMSVPINPNKCYYLSDSFFLQIAREKGSSI